MRFDVTKIPLGEALVGFVLIAVVLTFVLAYTFAADGGLEDGEVVADASPTPAADGTPGATPGGGTEAAIAIIPVLQFDSGEITVPAGEPVTLTVDNQEPGIPHNWALYTDETAAEQLAVTSICADCTETVTFDAPEPGQYFFRCDVHPVQMVGTFVVE